MSLVRLKANPQKVRVAVQKVNETDWIAKISSRETMLCVSFTHENPKIALQVASVMASKAEIDGMDLNMDFSYEHPWK